MEAWVIGGQKRWGTGASMVRGWSHQLDTKRQGQRLDESSGKG